MTLGPVRVMGAGVVVMLCVEEVITKTDIFASYNITLIIKDIMAPGFKMVTSSP